MSDAPSHAQHVLITGGSGFVGQALCPHLVSAGHRVTVLSRDPTRAARALPEAVTCISQLDDTPAPVDAVVNLAGENLGAGRWTAKRKQRFHESRIGLTETVVTWMRRQDPAPPVLVSASAVGYYGAQGDTRLDESAAPVDEYQHRLCRDWEAAACAAEAFGTRVVRLRIGVVLDAGGGALASMLPAFRWGGGAWLGRGNQWMSWIHRADLVALISQAITHPSYNGAVNAVAPQPATNKAFSKALGAALRRPVLLPVPGPVLRLLVGEMAHLLLTGQRVVPAAAEQAGFRHAFATVEQAFADIVRRAR